MAPSPLDKMNEVKSKVSLAYKFSSITGFFSEPRSFPDGSPPPGSASDTVKCLQSKLPLLTSERNSGYTFLTYISNIENSAVLRKKSNNFPEPPKNCTRFPWKTSRNRVLPFGGSE